MNNICIRRDRVILTFGGTGRLTHVCITWNPYSASTEIVGSFMSFIRVWMTDHLHSSNHFHCKWLCLEHLIDTFANSPLWVFSTTEEFPFVKDLPCNAYNLCAPAHLPFSSSYLQLTARRTLGRSPSQEVSCWRTINSEWVMICFCLSILQYRQKHIITHSLLNVLKLLWLKDVHWLL